MLAAAVSLVTAIGDVPIQADILFPLNDTIYNSALNPLPVVVRLVNSTADWASTGFFLTWQLVPPPDFNETVTAVASGQFSHYANDTDAPPPDDIYFDFLITHNPDGMNYAPGPWRLWLTFGLVDECHPNGTTYFWSSMYHIDFTTSTDGGYADLSDPGFCAPSLGALMPMNPPSLSMCPLKQTSAPLLPIQCATRGGQNLSDSTTVAIAKTFNTDFSPLANMTWPDGISRNAYKVAYNHTYQTGQGHHSNRIPGLATIMLLGWFIGWMNCYL